MSRIVKISEAQLRSVVNKMIREQTHYAPGMMSPGANAEMCDKCGQHTDPDEISPAGLCPDCEWSMANEEEELQCPQCDSPMDPDAIEDNPGGFCDSCQAAEEESEEESWSGKF